MKQAVRFELVDDVSQSRRVHDSHSFLDFDLTDFLDSSQLQEFQEHTGLQKSPVTLVLSNRCREGASPSSPENKVVVAFLHGLGGGRRSWGIGQATRERRESFVLRVLHCVESMGREAVGVVLAGLGRDGGTLDPIVGEVGITPRHYCRQLEFVLRYLDLWNSGKILGIGHSVGAAALWEFASRSVSGEDSWAVEAGSKPDVSVVATSPVRAIPESRFLSLGCRIAGNGLDLLVRPVVGLWHFASDRLSNLMAMASVLKGLGRQGPFRGTLTAVKGLVVVGERDWISRTGLYAALWSAGCMWPVMQLAGLGHDLLGHPVTERVLISYLPNLL